ncbi:uncharacterized protein V6R79_016104 [Siganus canaliculatus]
MLPCSSPSLSPERSGSREASKRNYPAVGSLQGTKVRESPQTRSDAVRQQCAKRAASRGTDAVVSGCGVVSSSLRFRLKDPQQHSSERSAASPQTNCKVTPNVFTAAAAAARSVTEKPLLQKRERDDKHAPKMLKQNKTKNHWGQEKTRLEGRQVRNMRGTQAEKKRSSKLI